MTFILSGGSDCSGKVTYARLNIPVGTPVFSLIKFLKFVADELMSSSIGYDFPACLMFTTWCQLLML